MKIKLNIKNVLTLGIAAIIVTTISLFFINTSLAANTAKVTVDTANLRETADSDSKILDLVNKGESVEVLETKGEWPFDAFPKEFHVRRKTHVALMIPQNIW